LQFHLERTVRSLRLVDRADFRAVARIVPLAGSAS